VEGVHKKRDKTGCSNYRGTSLLSTSYKILSNIPLSRFIILPVVVYECETWSLILREEHRLRVFLSRMLRRIFRPKRDEVTGDWRKLNNEELHKVFSPQNLIK
jgi:hypothetical protein